MTLSPEKIKCFQMFSEDTPSLSDQTAPDISLEVVTAANTFQRPVGAERDSTLLLHLLLLLLLLPPFYSMNRLLWLLFSCKGNRLAPHFFFFFYPFSSLFSEEVEMQPSHPGVRRWGEGGEEVVRDINQVGNHRAFTPGRVRRGRRAVEKALS